MRKSQKLTEWREAEMTIEMHPFASSLSVRISLPKAFAIALGTYANSSLESRAHLLWAGKATVECDSFQRQVGRFEQIASLIETNPFDVVVWR